ncbi:MAG: 3-dehydroquinate synthase [Pseudomonadales bacterium]|nr:3-dehydroquinate synthase [Pseudomonadales bacterium]
METVQVALGERSYPIYVGEDLLTQPELMVPHLGSGRAVVVTNETVAPLYGEQTRQLIGDHYGEQIVLPDGEEHKHLDTIAHIYDHLMQGKYDRKTTLVALGGGVIGDITGFAAATYQRGINFIQIPTTLLAQVDSSVGGKTGVNHPLGKNMIGAFYQPQCVLIDTTVLNTLPEREVKAGLAEVLKYGLIIDADFFGWLEANAEAVSSLASAELTQVIKTCCEIKADVVARDERESGIRALLNLGHTFGHAIETAAGYGTLLHGETVAMGMVMAADLSCRLAWIEPSTAQHIRQVIETKFGMPAVPPADITEQQYRDLMASDKKAEQGKIRFILLKAIGEAVISADVDSALLTQTLTAGPELCQF